MSISTSECIYNEIAINQSIRGVRNVELLFNVTVLTGVKPVAQDGIYALCVPKTLLQH